MNISVDKTGFPDTFFYTYFTSANCTGTEYMVAVDYDGLPLQDKLVIPSAQVGIKDHLLYYPDVSHAPISLLTGSTMQHLEGYPSHCYPTPPQTTPLSPAKYRDLNTLGFVPPFEVIETK